jgi:hypothetical protein
VEGQFNIRAQISGGKAMSKPKKLPKEVLDEIEYYQKNSETLAAQPADGFPEMKPFHETTTLAVRMVKSEADAITRLARERAVPVSSLLRTWIVDGYIHETGDSVSSTIADLEQVVRRLRRELKHG